MEPQRDRGQPGAADELNVLRDRMAELSATVERNQLDWERLT